MEQRFFRKRCGKDLIFFHHHTLESDNLFPLHIVKTDSISTGLTGLIPQLRVPEAAQSHANRVHTPFGL